LKNLFGLPKKNNAEPIAVPSTSLYSPNYETKTISPEKIESKNTTDLIKNKKR
jgi:hypothetical protein